MKRSTKSLLLSLVFAALLGSTPSLAQDTLEGRVVRLVNEARQARGLKPLTANVTLDLAARRHATDMAAQGFVGTTGSDGTRTTDRIVAAGYRYDRAAEVVAAHASDPRTIVDLWLRNGDGRGILTPEVSEIGVGVVAAPVGAPAERPGPFWTVTLARPVPTLVALAQIRDRTLALLNAERGRSGLPAVRLDPRLNIAAEAHAADMARADFLDHAGSDGSSPAERASRGGYPAGSVVLENVAQGTVDADETVKGWMESPGHRRNMLDPRVIDIGLAVADGDPLNGSGILRRYWALTLGAPR